MVHGHFLPICKEIIGRAIGTFSSESRERLFFFISLIALSLTYEVISCTLVAGSFTPPYSPVSHLVTQACHELQLSILVFGCLSWGPYGADTPIEVADIGHLNDVFSLHFELNFDDSGLCGSS